MRKTWFSIGAAVMLCVLLAGCGKGPEELSGEIRPETAPQASAQTQQDNSLSLGRIEGGTYRNLYGGFGCTLDDSWTFWSAQELQQLPAQVAQQMEDAEIGQLLGEYEQITDMMAENMEQLSTINVLFQKVPLQERAAVLSMGEGEAIDQLAQRDGEMMKAAYAQADIDVTEMKRIQVNFLGQERSALYTEASTQGLPMYMVQLMDYTRGPYSVTITFTSYVEDNTRSMMELFFTVS